MDRLILSYALLQIPFRPSNFFKNTSGDFQSQLKAAQTIILVRLGL
jgi:hypothetical protein